LNAKKTEVMAYNVAHAETKTLDGAGKSNRGSQRLTYVDKLRKDTELQTTAELKTLMKDKCEWRAIARADST